MATCDEKHCETWDAGSDAWYKTISDITLKVAYRFARDRDIAEDLAQDVLYKVAKNENPYIQLTKNDLTRKLYAITKNRWIDHYRKRKNIFNRMISFDDPDNSALQNMIPDRSAEQWIKDLETRSELEWIFRQLPPIERKVLILKYLQECTYEEIALKTHKTVDAVDSCLRRALKKNQKSEQFDSF